MATVTPKHEQMDAIHYNHSETTKRYDGAMDGSSPLIAPYIHSKEMCEELPQQQPARRAHKRRVALAGWVASALLGSILIWTYLPPTQPVALFSSPSVSAGVSGASHEFENLFVFGDSYSTTMFDVTGTQPSEENPLGNTNNTKSVWVEFLTTLYNSTVLRTYDLAVGGSTVDRDVVLPRYMASTSLKQQVFDVFAPTYGKGNPQPTAAFTSDDTLFAIWFGINDIVISAGQMQYTPLAKIFDSYRSSMEELYRNGARHFLLVNVPPIDNVYRSYDTTTMRSDIDGFNSRLLSLRLHFQRDHPDTTTWIFDVHELYTQVIRKPNAYAQTSNLKNVTDVCSEYLMDQSVGDVFAPSCGFPLSQYFWQNLHTTAAVHNVTAALIAHDCLGPEETSPSGYCS